MDNRNDGQLSLERKSTQKKKKKSLERETTSKPWLSASTCKELSKWLWRVMFACIVQIGLKVVIDVVITAYR